MALTYTYTTYVLTFTISTIPNWGRLHIHHRMISALTNTHTHTVYAVNTHIHITEPLKSRRENKPSIKLSTHICMLKTSNVYVICACAYISHCNGCMYWVFYSYVSYKVENQIENVNTRKNTHSHTFIYASTHTHACVTPPRRSSRLRGTFFYIIYPAKCWLAFLPRRTTHYIETLSFLVCTNQ